MQTSWIKVVGLILIGFLPLIAWEIFALTYYGFPFPNTYYAKVAAVNLPEGWFHDQAWSY